MLEGKSLKFVELLEVERKTVYIKRQRRVILSNARINGIFREARTKERIYRCGI